MSFCLINKIQFTNRRGKKIWWYVVYISKNKKKIKYLYRAMCNESGVKTNWPESIYYWIKHYEMNMTSVHRKSIYLINFI